MSYDDKGERILKKTASVNEYYLRDHTGRELAIYDLTTNWIKMANIFGNGLIGRFDVNYTKKSGFYYDEDGTKTYYSYYERSDNRNYYLKDHLGSNRLTINSLGVITNAQDYYAYGEVLRSYNNSTPNEKYKFTGKERDTETDLDYFGARFYDSEIGRWLSIDPLADKYPAWSPYNYCAENPLKFVDPDGKDIKMIFRHPHRDAGHIILQVIDNKSGKIKATWSFGPNETSKKMLLGSPVKGKQGEPNMDIYLKDKKYTEATMKTDVSTDDKVATNIEDRKKNNESYDLTTNNCGTTAVELLNKSGVQVGESYIPTPALIFEEFKKAMEKREAEQKKREEEEKKKN